MFLPSSDSVSIFEKKDCAKSVTAYMLSRRDAASFCSFVCWVSSTSILYFLARNLIASGNVKCSCSIKNETTFPPFPLLKSFQICLAGETIKLGVFSFENGLSPLKFEPDFFSCTKSPMTSSRRAVSKTRSTVDLLIKIGRL